MDALLAFNEARGLLMYEPCRMRGRVGHAPRSGHDQTRGCTFRVCGLRGLPRGVQIVQDNWWALMGTGVQQTSCWQDAAYNPHRQARWVVVIPYAVLGEVEVQGLVSDDKKDEDEWPQPPCC